MHALTANVYKNAQEAIADGHVYLAPTKPLTLQRAVIIQDGTINGKPTVDLVFTDTEGNQYVAMTTNAILDMVQSCVAGVVQRVSESPQAPAPGAQEH
jgi:hypothetical protein